MNGKDGPFAQILPGVRLGTLALDSCTSPPRAALLTAALLTGETAFTDRFRHTLSPQDVVGVVGGGLDNTTLDVGAVLAHSRLPHVAFAAESALLADPNLFPAALAAKHSDATRIRLLIQLIQALPPPVLAVNRF